MEASRFAEFRLHGESFAATHTFIHFKEFNSHSIRDGLVGGRAEARTVAYYRTLMYSVEQCSAGTVIQDGFCIYGL